MANEEVLGPRKTMFVLVIVVGCFAVLWPRILSPLIMGASREQLKPNQFDRETALKQERPPNRGAAPHPALRERGRAIPPGVPSPPAKGPVAMPPHARVRTSPLSGYFELDIKPPPIPGMRPPLGSPGGPVPAPKSSMGFVMPIYTICIIVFFVYTLSKILFKRTGTSPYEPITPDPQFRRRVFRDDSRSSPDKLVVTAISGLVAEVQQQMEASYAQNQQRQDVQQDNHTRPYTNGTILHNSGPVHIVASEYQEAPKDNIADQKEKDVTSTPEAIPEANEIDEKVAKSNDTKIGEKRESAPELAVSVEIKADPVELNLKATESTVGSSLGDVEVKDGAGESQKVVQTLIEESENNTGDIFAKDDDRHEDVEETDEERKNIEEEHKDIEEEHEEIEKERKDKEEERKNIEEEQNKIGEETTEEKLEIEKKIIDDEEEIEKDIVEEEIEEEEEIIEEEEEIEKEESETFKKPKVSDVTHTKTIATAQDVKTEKNGDIRKTEAFLREETNAVVEEHTEKQSTPELLEDAIKDEEDEDEKEKSSVKHEAESVQSIYLETEIPQQSRVLVADFAEDRADKPEPTKHSPMVVSGKMTLSLIQDAPRETPERDQESTVDDFTTASAVTQNAQKQGEESDEESEEEIEIEEIEEEVEEEEEEEVPKQKEPNKAK